MAKVNNCGINISPTKCHNPSVICKFLYMVCANGRMNPYYKQMGTVTGRITSERPNIQVLERNSQCPLCLRSDKGHIYVKNDYSQIELRVLASPAKDERKLEAFYNGTDLRWLTASLIIGKATSDVTNHKRQLAKNINFRLAYGMGAKSLAENARKSFGISMTDGD